MTDFGYPTKKPCDICGEWNNNQIEPRFGFTVCEPHQTVPPIEIKREPNERS